MIQTFLSRLPAILSPFAADPASFEGDEVHVERQAPDDEPERLPRDEGFYWGWSLGSNL